jgi:TetR/AcrR family transcriptional regulator of autoinduction and epiphytic fitness
VLSATPPRASVTQKSEEKRRRILDAGIMLFARHGIAGTRLSDIAGRARLAKATLYYYFPEGKETIFSRAIRSVVSEVYERFRAEVLAQPDALSQLQTYIYERVAIFDRELTSRGVAQEVWLELKPLAERVLQPYFEQEQHLVREIIAEGVRNGTFCATDPDIAAGMLTAALRGITADGPIDITPAARRQQVDAVFQLFTRGLLAPPSA